MSQIEEAKVTAKRRDQRRLDMFVNAYNGFGGYKDPMNRITFGAGTVLNKVELESLFRFDWVARRIIEAIPEDATRQWIDVKADDNAIITDLMGRMETLEVQNKIEEALVLARLYGGAVIIIGALDGQLPDTPLNEDKISAVRFLNVLDRWQLQIDKTYDDPMQPDFGHPEIYRLQPIISGTGTGPGAGTGIGLVPRVWAGSGSRTGSGSSAGLGSVAWAGSLPRQNQRIHESRLIRFDGAYLPEISKIQNSGWYDSILIAINEELKRHGTSVQSGAILMQDFITKALKLPNLAELLSNPEGQTALLTRVQWAIANTSSLGITLLGEDEEFTKIQTPIAGLVDLLNLYIELISAAAGIPRARLFGQSLGVLAGATETTRAYYDMVKSYQNKHMRRQIEKLIRIFLKDKSSKTRGREPQEWSFDFCQLWQPTEKEKAEVRKLMADTDQIYINTGVVTPDEIASSRFSPDGYSMETTIDFGLRAEFEKQAQEAQKVQAEAAAAGQTEAAGQAESQAQAAQAAAQAGK